MKITSFPFDLKAIKHKCRDLRGIRPLISKHSGELSFEADAGQITDPNTGKKKKQRKTFGVAKYEGSVERAFEAAKNWAAEMRQVSTLERSAVIALPMPLRGELLYLAELCKKEKLDVLDVMRKGLEILRSSEVAKQVTFKQAAQLTIAQKIREGKSKPYLGDLTYFYKTFGREFDHRRLHEITAEQIEEWLEDREVGAVTWNNYRRELGVLWSFGLTSRNGWVNENVIEEVIQQDVKHEEVTALTPVQAKTILATAERQIPRLIPYLCVSMFAGLRRSEAQDISWDDFDWETQSIRVRSGKMRSVTSRYVEMETALIDWLKPIAKVEGDLCTGQFARRKDLKELRRLTFNFDGNIFRHTFGSYHYHYYKNPGKTIVEMGHTTPMMLHKHYRKPVSKAVAQKFWDLTREVVLKDGPNGADQ